MPTAERALLHRGGRRGTWGSLGLWHDQADDYAEACEALAHVRIEALNRRLGVALPEEEDFETIGGFVFHQFGRIPEVGERIESHGAALEVLAATRRRIDLVRVERLAPGPAGGPRDGR